MKTTMSARRVRLLAFSILTFALSVPAAEAQEAELEVVVVPSTVAPGEIAILRYTLSMPEDLHQTRQEEFFFLEVDSLPGITFGETEYPEGRIVDGIVNYYDVVVLTREIRVDEGASAGARRLRVTVGYQLCNEAGVCFFPEERVFEATLAVGRATAGLGAGLGAWTIVRFLLMALLGGILLNVMPCVLPVLSIKALSLVKQGGDDRRRILLSAYAYSAGILVSFLVLAVVVVVLKLSGELVGWGFQFQNPTFVIVLLTVVFGFSLSLFDVYVIMPMGTGLASRASGSHGYLGSFATGVMAVLLATPCTAPFLGAALGFAFSQPPAIIFAILLMVGVGLATPFLLLGIWPGIVQRIPKPGPWMDVFKTIMGFLLVGTAVYLLDVLLYQIGGRNLIRVVIFLVVVAAAGWVYGHFGKPGRVRWNRWVSLAVAAALISAGAAILLRFDDSATGPGAASEMASESKEGWAAFSPELVDDLRQRGQAVFVDFGARWCWTCKVNETAVLDSGDIMAAFAAAEVALVYGDYTNKDQTISEWIRSFDRAGVPLYLFYPPDGAEPVVLPELLTKKMILDLLAEYTQSANVSPFSAPFK